ncbi:uncharacterized protein N0V89_005860 [Didymosphaeria variabile]|uniref:NAD(P)-binding protein n=1 Tax=Didymosphaeria variabile TaxID=1932322 RepID=A0A9W9CBL4_9PLEO|nr:uncharacterized protein N0V89_005860 [Didymosphaeria variabile]KAJ4354127.1 hypothetical protein N0V89_005860 [Didymosphaeria variabile]
MASSSAFDSSSLFRVDGIVAVITGGGTGIGLTMTRALAFNGAKKVYIIGRRLEKLEEAAREHESIIPIQGDVTSKADLQAAVDQITNEVGYVNLVIANSGDIGPPVRFNPDHSIKELRETLFTNANPEKMTNTLNLNVTAAFFTMTAFVELLDAGNKQALLGGYGKPAEGSKVPLIQSHVIFTTSISAYSRHWTSSPAYLSSKVAIMQVAKHASSQLAHHGIRVNAIAPGSEFPALHHPALCKERQANNVTLVYPSELAAVLIKSRKPEEEVPSDAGFVPAKRFGTDEEMSGVILYLSSRAGAYTNGSILTTDGGRLSVIASTY